MEDDKYINNIKEGVTGSKLPTMDDLKTEYNSPLETPPPIQSGQTIQENPIPELSPIQNRMASSPENTASPEPQVSGEKKTNEVEFKEILFNKLTQLHDEGKTIDEIYGALKSQGYGYENIEEAILRLVEAETNPETAGKPIKPEVPQRPVMRPIQEELPHREIMRKNELMATKYTSPVKIDEMPKNEFAPLFVKVGRYRETLETIENLENYLRGMSKLFDLVNELEKIRVMNITALNKMYQKASITASKLYSGLLKPKGMKLEGDLESKVEMDKLEEVVSDLNNELTNLRDEIEKIKNIE
ncbi:MAG: hypothetical protein DRP06_00870 [Candidatus Aenigmatarchaeota archaeon]|nr:MAG: hypothetical protein DRP06_00870 [Candidatus Aenigmarchaeota archaeon]